jgi:hypothetical protein
MNVDWNHIIHKYINRSLTSDEQQLFDKLYTENEEFKAEVKLIDDLHVVLESQDHDNLKEIMAEAEEEINNSNGQKAWFLSIKWWLFLVILLIALTLSFYFLQSRHSSPQLYASYYQTPANTHYPVLRGESDQSATSLAFLAYEQENYRKAEELLSSLTPTDKINFYHAISLGELGKFKNAINLLDSINSNDELLQEDVWWYKGLYQLAISDKTGAINSFNNMKPSTNPRRKKLVDTLLE